MSSLGLSRSVFVRACQVRVTYFVTKASVSRLVTTSVSQGWVRQSALRTGSGPTRYFPKLQSPPRSFAVYRGASVGYKSTKVAVRAQHEGKAASAQHPPKPEKTRDAFCRMCGTKMQLAIPKGEASWRETCNNCGYIDYINPKMVRHNALSLHIPVYV